MARRFAADGARVVATARRVERVEALASEFGPLILPLALDVRDRPAVAAAHAVPSVTGVPAASVQITTSGPAWVT